MLATAKSVFYSATAKKFVNHKRANAMKTGENERKTEIAKHKLKFKEKVLDNHRHLW